MRTLTRPRRLPVWAILSIFVLFAFALPHIAMAAGLGGAGGAMPWDAPLTTIVTDLTGPTAFSLGLIAVVAAAMVLVFGGELSHFLRGLVYIVFVIGLLTAAPTFAQSLGIAGAVVT